MALDVRCWVEIDEAAFRHNIRSIASRYASPAALMVAVKANAYGHGAARMAQLALEEGAAALAVLDVETGCALREEFPDVPMLCWLLSPGSDYRGAIEASLTLGISHRWQLEAIRAVGSSKRAVVHLKIDTGLHRNGALAANWPELTRLAAECEQEGSIRVEGVWSHLADTSLEEDRASLQRFHGAVDLARDAGLSPSVLHIAASAAAADLPEARLDMVRVGLLAYGVSPSEERPIEEYGLQPVMSFRAFVGAVDEASGECVLECGYTDGLLPLPENTGHVSLGGQRVDIRHIGPDRTTVVLGAASPRVGDIATLWGPGAPGAPRVEDWAAWAGTIGDEVIAGVAAHVRRVYLGEGANRS